MLKSTPGLSDQNVSIFELAPFPTWIYDLETLQFLAVNQEAVRHYGYTEKEFLNMTIKDIRPVEDIPKLEKAVEEARRRDESYKQSVYRHQKNDGSLIYVQIKSNLINYQGKRAEIVTTIDLSERYEQEEQLEKHKKFLSILADINQLLLKSDNWAGALEKCFQIAGEAIEVDRMYFFQNNIQDQTTSQRLEWARDDIESQIDNPNLQNIPYSELPLFMEPLQKGKAFKAIVSALPSSPMKEMLAAQDIKSILVLPILVDHQFVGFVGLDDCKNERIWQQDEFRLLHTITSNLSHVIAESQAFQKLSDSEAKFRSLVQNGTDLIAILNEYGIFTYVAPNSTKVLGIPPDNFLGESAFDFINEEDTHRVKILLEEVLEKDRVFIEPFRFQDAEGNWRWIQTELTNHLNDPVISGIVANTREVTAEVEKRLGDELVLSLTKAIAQPGPLSACLTEGVEILAKLPKISVSEVWLLSEDKTRLNLISKACREENFNSFYHQSKDVDNFKKRVGLPGYVWDIQKTSVWQDLSADHRFVRSAAAKSANLQTAIGLPIIYNKEFLGCFICFSELQKEKFSDQLNLLTEVGLQLGAVIKQKATEEEYRTFFEISPDPHCVVGFDGYIKKYNKAFYKLLGYEEQDLSNNPIFYFIYEADKARAGEKLKSSTQGDSIQSFEARCLTKSGEVRWLIWNGSAIPESKIIITVAKDITEQKSAEQKLGTAYERLKTAQKIAKLGYWIYNFDVKISEWSEETYQIFGRSPENFVPTMESVKETFHPDDRYLIERYINEHLKSGQVQSYEHRILTESGEVRWIHQEIRLVTDKGGVPVRIEGTVQDITERKEYEEQLAISNEKFRLAMHASNEMIWEIDHQSLKITRGEGYEGTFYYDTNEFFTKNNSWFDKIHPEDLEEVWNSFQETLKNKDAQSWRMEYKVLSEDGSIAYFVDRCYILRDEKGKPMRSVGSALDVTASRQQLERIKKQNENLREIAWLQSHIIRAPLSRIMSLVYLSNELDGGGKTKEEIMGMIADSANELDDVIFQITDKTNAIKDEDSGNFAN